MRKHLQQCNTSVPTLASLKSGLFSWKKNNFLLFCFLFSLSFSFQTFAQNLLVAGKVTDQDGNALSSASVTVKNTQAGRSTDADGKFSISVPGINSVLVFTSIGFTTQEVPVNNRSTINLSMTPDATALKDVVVVGYGVQKKKSLTGGCCFC